MLKYLKIFITFSQFFIRLFYVLLLFLLFCFCANNKERKRSPENNKTQKITVIEKTIEDGMIKDIDVPIYLDSMCQCQIVNNAEKLGHLKILNINQPGRCFCKSTYLQNSKKNLFCMDYFFEYQESIEIYNKFIVNENILIQNELSAEKYFRSLLSLCNVYELICIDQKSNKSNVFRFTGTILRKYARNPIDFEDNNTTLSFVIEIDLIGLINVVEINRVIPE